MLEVASPRQPSPRNVSCRPYTTGPTRRGPNVETVRTNENDSTGKRGPTPRHGHYTNRSKTHSPMQTCPFFGWPHFLHLYGLGDEECPASGADLELPVARVAAGKA